MRNMIAMDVLNSIDDLLEIKSSLVFRDLLILHILVELSITRKFHNDKNIIGSVQHFVELDNVGMAKEFQYSYLSFHLLRPILTLEIMLVFFIFFLLIILTATSMLVRSCLAARLVTWYF